MKRLFFAFFAILLSMWLLGYSLMHSSSPDGKIKIDSIHGGFSSTGQVFLTNSENSWKIIDSNSEGQITVDRFSPLSVVFFPKDQTAPTLSEKEGVKHITIDKGVFFFSFEDIFENISIDAPTFSIQEVARGSFFVDSRDESNIRIYSLSSILSVSLLSSDDHQKMSDLMIFPSMLFVHDPKMNGELKNADILRIATINSLSYETLRSENGISDRVAKDSTAISLIEASAFFTAERDKELKKGIKQAMQQKTWYQTALFDLFPFLFVNSPKKSILLQNNLFAKAQEIYTYGLKKSWSDSSDAKKITSKINSIESDIQSILQELGNISQSDKAEWLEILHAFYVTSYPDLSGQYGQINPFISLAQKVFSSKVTVASAEYTILSDIYRDELQKAGDVSQVSDRLDTYIRSLIAEKRIRKEDFLSFVFFLKEYLSHPIGKMGSNEMNIVYYYINLSNQYYSQITSDSEKFSLLSVYFYNYDKIFTKINENIVSEYFSGSESPYRLKDEYIGSDGNAKIEDGYIAAINLVLKSFEETNANFSEQTSLYYKMLTTESESGASDRYTIFQQTIAKFKEISSVFLGYREYKDRTSLKKEAQAAAGIVFSNEEFPDLEGVKKYFSAFTGFQPDTLQIEGGWKEQGYLELKFQMDSYTVSLKFTPQKEIIEDLIFANGSTVNRLYRNYSISLEEKKEIFDKQKDGKARYANFFQNTFFSPVSNNQAITQAPTDSNNSMSPEMTLFVDRELIGKDFQNVASIFPVTLQNIHAEVKNGEYDIDISKVQSTLSFDAGNGKRLVERVEWKGKYIFLENTHAFSHLSLTVFNKERWQDFNGAAIEIIPNQINLLDFSSVTAQIPSYIEVLRQNGYSWVENATFDLSNKMVIIGTNQYPLD